MSFSNRLHFAALRRRLTGPLIFAIAVASAQGIAQGDGPETKGYSERQEEASSSPQPTRQPEFTFVAPVIIPEEKKTDPGPYQPDCEQPKDVEDANFCVARRAAKAAEDSARAGEDAARAGWDAAKTAYVQLILAGFGLLGVLTTIALTFWAALATSHSARSAAASAVAAEKSVAITRSAFVAERRPRVRVFVDFEGDYHCDGNVAQLQLKIRIENFGKSEARNVMALVSTYPGGRGGTIESTYRRLSESLSGRGDDVSYFSDALFPTEDQFISEQFSLALWHRQNVDTGIQNGAETDTLGVCVCVDYLSNIAPDHFQSGVSYLLMRRESSGYRSFPMVAETINRRDLMLLLQPNSRHMT